MTPERRLEAYEWQRARIADATDDVRRAVEKLVQVVALARIENPVHFSGGEDVIFYFIEQGEEILRVTPTGEILIDGKPTQDPGVLSDAIRKIANVHRATLR